MPDATCASILVRAYDARVFGAISACLEARPSGALGAFIKQQFTAEGAENAEELLLRINKPKSEVCINCPLHDDPLCVTLRPPRSICFSALLRTHSNDGAGVSRLLQLASRLMMRRTGWNARTPSLVPLRPPKAQKVGNR